MKRYEMIGRPIGAPFTVLTDHTIGDVFEADLDDDVERMLVGAGALRVTKKSGPKQAVAEPPEPEPEPEPAPEPEPKPESEPPAPEPDPTPEPRPDPLKPGSAASRHPASKGTAKR